jgi:hypothetical protein
MLFPVAPVTQNLSGWISLNVPIDHSLDPSSLLLPSELFDSRSAEVDDVSHPDLAVVNVKIICR